MFVRKATATVLFGAAIVPLMAGAFGACALVVFDTVLDPTGASAGAYTEALAWMALSGLMFTAAYRLWR